MKIDLGNVWVINDLCGDVEFNKQMISIAKCTAERANKKVIVLDFNCEDDSFLKEYCHYGADVIVKCHQDNALLSTIKNVCFHYAIKYKPYLIICGNKSKNRELASALATKLEIGLVAECIDMAFDSSRGRIIFSRTAINSSVMADIICDKSETQMCTVKKDCFMQRYYEGVRGEVISNEFSDKSGRVGNNIELLGKEELKCVENLLKLDSKVVLGVGRGAVKDLEMVRILAKNLGADLGATRPLVEEGIMKRSQQIGQSGNLINPSVYVALGISGASQHLVGITKANTIISVNIDENAPIKKYSDYFIHGSINHFVSKILEIMK